MSRNFYLFSFFKLLIKISPEPRSHVRTFSAPLLSGNVRGCKVDLETHKEIPFLCVMVKSSKEKSNRKKQKNSDMLLWQKTIYLKVLLQKVFNIATKNSLANLTVMVDGRWIYWPGIFLSMSEEFHGTPLSSLPDYYWS